MAWGGQWQSAAVQSHHCAGPANINKAKWELKWGRRGWRRFCLLQLQHFSQGNLGWNLQIRGTTKALSFFHLALGLHLEMLQHTKLTALGYLAARESTHAPRWGWAERGGHLFALILEHKLWTKKCPGTQHWSDQHQLCPASRWSPWHVQHGGAEELQGKEPLTDEWEARQS